MAMGLRCSLFTWNFLWLSKLLTTTALILLTLPVTAQAIGNACQKAYESAALYIAREMVPGSYGDDIYDYKTVFYNESERKAFQLHVGSDGKIRNSKNEVLTLYGRFVMDDAGNIYFEQLELQKPGRHHHSSYLAGGPAAAAGGMMIMDGKVVFIDNGSGHYKQSLAFTKQLLHRLKALGADISDIKIEDFNGQTMAELPDFTSEDFKQIKNWNLRARIERFEKLTREQQAHFLYEILMIKDSNLTSQLLLRLPSRDSSGVRLLAEVSALIKDPRVFPSIAYGVSVYSAEPEIVHLMIDPWLKHRSHLAKEAASIVLNKMKNPTNASVLKLMADKDFLKKSATGRVQMLMLVNRDLAISNDVKNSFYLEVLNFAEMGLKNPTEFFMAEVNLAIDLYSLFKKVQTPKEIFLRLRNYFTYIAENAPAGYDPVSKARSYQALLNREFQF